MKTIVTQCVDLNVEYCEVSLLFIAIVFISCSLSTNQFWTAIGGGHMRAANLRLCWMNWNSNVFQMHADERVANIDASRGFNMLNHNGLAESVVSRCCKRAATMQPWHHADGLVAVTLGTFGLNHKRAVQVLAALAGKVNATF